MRMIEGFRLEPHGKEDLLIITHDSSISLRFLLNTELEFYTEGLDYKPEKLIEVHRVKAALARMTHDVQTWIDENAN